MTSETRRVVVVDSPEIAERGPVLFLGARTIYANGSLPADALDATDAVIVSTDRERIEQFCAAFAAVQCAKVRFWEQDLSGFTERQQVLDAAGGIQIYVSAPESGEAATLSGRPPPPESGSGAEPVENSTPNPEQRGGESVAESIAPAPSEPGDDDLATVQTPATPEPAQDALEPPQDAAPPDWHNDVPDESETVLRNARTAAEVKKAAFRQAQSETPAEWPDPADFWQATALPEFLPEYLPPAIEPYVTDQASRAGLDPAQVALNCYVVCAALIRTGIELQMQESAEDGRTWKEKPILWAAVVGDPSSGKGPAMDIALHKAQQIEHRMRLKDAEAWEKYEMDAKIYEKRVQSYIAEAAKSPLAVKPDAPEKPPKERLFIDDATKEVVAKLLTENPRGKLCVLKDELASWFGSMGAYSSTGAEKDRGDWLSFYESKQKWIDRAMEGRSYHVPSWGGCIIGGIQPEILSRISAKLGADGMLQRFQIIVAAPKRQVPKRASDQDAIKQWNRVQENLAAMQSPPYAITLSPEAAAFMDEQAQWIAQSMQAGFIPSLVAALGKWEGLWGRLAITSHCIEAAQLGLGHPPAQVSLKTMEQAFGWMRWILFPHAAHFYMGFADQGEDAAFIKKFAEFVLARAVDRVRPHWLASNWSTYRYNFRTIQARREFWSRIEQAGWARPIGIFDRASSLASEYEINPLALDGRFDVQAVSARMQAERYRQAMHPAMLARQGREPGED